MLASITQTLTTLGLSRNKIGDTGAKHLAGALKVNRVSDLFLGLRGYSMVAIVIDTHYTNARIQQSR